MPPEKCKCKSLKVPEYQRTNAYATILHWEPEATSCLRCRTVQKSTNTNTMQMPKMLCYLTSANTNTMQMQMTIKIIESQSQVIASKLLKYLQNNSQYFCCKNTLYLVMERRVFLLTPSSSLFRPEGADELFRLTKGAGGLCLTTCRSSSPSS